MASEHYTKLTDERALLESTAGGSREAFSALYAHYYHGLYRFVFFVLKSHEDAEEVIQDVFLKVWMKRETLPGILAFDDYLFRMAKNRLFDIGKESARRRQLLRIVGPAEEPGSGDVHDDLLYREYHAAAQEAIRQLPERRKAIFLLNARDELSAREIAGRMGMSLPSVKKELREASYFIRDYLRRHAGWILLLIFLKNNLLIQGILFLSHQSLIVHNL